MPVSSNKISAFSITVHSPFLTTGDEIRAAAVILDQSAKYLELYELRERIAHLEAKLKDREDGA